ncbi:uncharacterized protein K02A2.6-like [Armigeres subalbatus]|uniref:uncharacterized protein K02A2.6-like n=1 Tax=Armigeres subalbatus TaxID=124917 RepID=UPI002ED66788
MEEKHLLYFIDTGAIEICWDEIELYSDNDDELAKVRTAIETDHWETGLKKYESEAKELTIMGSMLYKGDRIVLPEQLRLKAIKSAHQGHMGIGSTKRILRQHFWWPGMNKSVEAFIKKCETCLLLSKKNPPIPLSSRELPNGPWEILQIDFFSDKEFGFGEFLVVVDIYSRYLHVMEMRHIDTESTIAALNKIFAVWGYPLVLQSDNGPPFQSDAFVRSWENRGIKVRKSIPLSPQSNGAVERQNEGIKKALAASRLDNANWKTALNNYVHMHNKVRPLTRLGVTPFELLVGWKHRGFFPSLWRSDSQLEVDREEVRENDAHSKLVSKKYADFRRGAKQSDLVVGDKVVLLQLKRTKSDPTFGAEKFTVIARDGAKLIVKSDRGVVYSRNVADAKRAIDDEGFTQQNQSHIPDDAQTSSTNFPWQSPEIQLFADHRNSTESEENKGSETDKTSGAQGLNNQLDHDDFIHSRPSRIKKVPEKLKDMILFNVYQ